MRNVLVIEDQQDIAHLVRLHLQDLPCKVELAFDGYSGLAAAHKQHFDLVVLDLMLPGMDGLEVCRRLRERPVYTPIMMLTAKAAELDRVLGLELGADDYLTKPFSIRELVARAKAMFRRLEHLENAAATPPDETLRCGDLFVDVARREVRVDGVPIALTSKEFDLLLHFVRNPGRVYTRLQLLDAVWGYGYDGYEHNVNCHINRLRAKVEKDQARPQIILTVRGVGYKLGEPQAALAES
ncbi:MAG: chemotaxis protein CheY [Betaproteobacteria bacterium]|jgi:two-component system OmpR family response regulator|nr:chemotaxis protein CheY [Betaproteobacteria bacterium]